MTDPVAAWREAQHWLRWLRVVEPDLDMARVDLRGVVTAEADAWAALSDEQRAELKDLRKEWDDAL